MDAVDGHPGASSRGLAASVAVAAVLNRCLELTVSGQPVHTWPTTPEDRH
jgi:hypothetical protein